MKERNLTILIVLLFVFFCVIECLQFKDCGSKIGKFTKIDIENCDTTAEECILERGTNGSIKINFIPYEDVSNIKTVVHGRILSVDFPFPLQDPDACHSQAVKCPLEKNIAYEYEAVLPILKSYPRVKVLVIWELKDQNGEDIVCVEIPAKIR